MASVGVRLTAQLGAVLWDLVLRFMGAFAILARSCEVMLVQEGAPQVDTLVSQLDETKLMPIKLIIGTNHPLAIWILVFAWPILWNVFVLQGERGIDAGLTEFHVLEPVGYISAKAHLHMRAHEVIK